MSDNREGKESIAGSNINQLRKPKCSASQSRTCLGRSSSRPHLQVLVHQRQRQIEGGRQIIWDWEMYNLPSLWM